MYTTVLDGIEFLIPDKYVETIRTKLGPDQALRLLEDLDRFRDAQAVDVLIDDPRYTEFFMSKNLDFVQENSQISLLAEKASTPGQPDQSFTRLLTPDGSHFRVTNLSEGESEHLDTPKSWRVVICGLGDVGGTLLSGLRLMGYETISELMIYDRNESKRERWYREVSQILDSTSRKMPPVRVISKDELFAGDVFIFCVSAGVPKVGQEAGQDVRLTQLKANSEILKEYLDLSSKANYQGSFFIVSDPVDQLCMFAFQNSTLRSHKIRGFGLGVMYARAMFHAREMGLPTDELRVYGPHGRGLRVVNSILGYDEALSRELTELTVTENLRIRGTGFKPYIGPALSSGAISILACLNEEWHYSSTLLDGIWFGARNRQQGRYVEYEALPLLKDTVEHLLNTRQGLLESMADLYRGALLPIKDSTGNESAVPVESRLTAGSSPSDKEHRNG